MTVKALLSGIDAMQAQLSEKESKTLQLPWLAKAMIHIKQLPQEDEKLEVIVRELIQLLVRYAEKSTFDNGRNKLWNKQVEALKHHLLMG